MHTHAWIAVYYASADHTHAHKFPRSLPPSYADGRESLAFMIDCAAWSPSCLVLGHTALSWLLRDIIPGQRQALLSVQVMTEVARLHPPNLHALHCMRLQLQAVQGGLSLTGAATAPCF